ncbi:MAG TPA: LCP family protein [Candidatus Acutalibacter pullicola]|uniref:LCP family protein n=1 Tax=Candidatus Acutalibacter pullicola TaxID=2838417 RepID=A0A9D2SF71_9FIRM|nr:LCP family protein [Candidatus Acutalibacter pullicola]
MKTWGKRGILWVGGVLGIGILVVLGVVLSLYTQARRTLQQAGEDREPKREVGVYVLQEDPAQELADAADYVFGRVQEENAAQTALETALGKAPAYAEYATVFALVDALREGACGAVLLEEAYQVSVGDARGYEWTQTDMRKLGVLELSVEEEEPMEVPPDTPDRFLLYLSGSDTFGDISTRSRSDVNILAAVDVPAREVLLVATPRDYYVSFSRTDGAKDKLAHTGIYGVAASVDALETLYQVDIDYYLRVNFTGFVEIIDALGGVNVYSDRKFTVENIRTYEEGYNQLTGIEALAFARERMSFPEGDFQRAKNQMEVIRAVVEKAASPALVWNFSQVLEALEGTFETNLPEEQILALAPKLSGDWEVDTFTAGGESAYRETWSMPGQELYVLLPRESSVEEARNLLNQALAE